MARYAMIENTSGIVVNVIEWDGDEATWIPPTGHTMVEDTAVVAGSGQSYDGAAFREVPTGFINADEAVHVATTSKKKK